MLLTWLPAALRKAGLTVVETPGWQSRSHGQLPDDFYVVWHHDASPKGDSPGALAWMISNWNSASAQLWINRQGVVHLVGSGIAFHAGRVDPGMPRNANSVGIETDHTVGEDWPPSLLNALRRTTVVLLRHAGRDEDGLHFHKTIAPSRKVDPDGLELSTERAAIRKLLAGPSKPSPTPSTNGTTDTEELEMVICHATTGSGNHVYGQLLFDGIHYIRDADVLNLMRRAGAKQLEVTRAQWNSARASGTGSI